MFTVISLCYTDVAKDDMCSTDGKVIYTSKIATFEYEAPMKAFLKAQENEWHKYLVVKSDNPIKIFQDGSTLLESYEGLKGYEE